MSSTPHSTTKNRKKNQLLRSSVYLIFFFSMITRPNLYISLFTLHKYTHANRFFIYFPSRYFLIFHHRISTILFMRALIPFFVFEWKHKCIHSLCYFPCIFISGSRWAYMLCALTKKKTFVCVSHVILFEK